MSFASIHRTHPPIDAGSNVPLGIPLADILKLNGVSSLSLLPKFSVPLTGPSELGVNRTVNVVLLPGVIGLPG